MKALFTIVLVHQFNRERRTVPVEAVTKTYVSIRWGQSGIYDLNFAKNTLTARSQKAQRKGKALWSAENIDEVIGLAKAYLAGGETKKEATERAIAKHNATMPIPKISEDASIFYSRTKPRFDLQSEELDELDLPAHVAPMAGPRDHERDSGPFEACDAVDHES